MGGKKSRQGAGQAPESLAARGSSLDLLWSAVKSHGRFYREGQNRNLFYLLVVFAVLHGMWGLSSLTRDQTQAPCIRNTESLPLHGREVLHPF